MSSELEANTFVDTLRRRIVTFDGFEKTLQSMQESLKAAYDAHERVARTYDHLVFGFSQLLGQHPDTRAVTPMFIKALENEHQYTSKFVSSPADHSEPGPKRHPGGSRILVQTGGGLTRKLSR